MKKITTIAELLDYSEELNKLITAENLRFDVTIMDIASDEDIEALAKQEGGSFFKPCIDLPWVWCTVKLGKVDFMVRGVKKNIEVKFN